MYVCINKSYTAYQKPDIIYHMLDIIHHTLYIILHMSYIYIYIAYHIYIYMHISYTVPSLHMHTYISISAHPVDEKIARTPSQWLRAPLRDGGHFRAGASQSRPASGIVAAGYVQRQSQGTLAWPFSSQGKQRNLVDDK